MKKIAHIIIYTFAAIGFVLVVGYIAVKLGWTNSKGVIDAQRYYIKDQLGSSSSTNAWAQGEEWQVLKQAILKDQTDIINAASSSGVSPRLIVSCLIVEQLRLFHDNREVFKAIFVPLKILGNQSQFSWGVMGIKQDTARAIESNLKDANSPWYLGPKYENTLDYPATTTDVDTARFNRLTDERGRYYSYLYSGIYIRELETQWQKAGFPINDRPDLIATLFNIGFNNSHPHSNPLSGGAEIDIGDQKYSFGSLAREFYDSSELLSEFPR